MHGGEFIGNFDANLAIVADRTRMERQECVLVDVLGEGFRRRRIGFEKAVVIDIDCLHKLIDQFVGQIVPANCKIIDSERDIGLSSGE